MPNATLAYTRLVNQHLLDTPLTTAQEAVRWLGAVQSQDYAGAKWALSLRTGLNESALDAAFDAGEILRTHVMRPTWHFVAPADIRWLLMLTAPRVNALAAYNYRRLELDETVFKSCQALLEKALQGDKHLTEAEIKPFFHEAKILIDDPLRLTHIFIRMELDGVIVSGARRGKQHTYALLEERVPPAPSLTREEALAELTRRYFTSHGPATPHDFAWWSGLTVTDAKAGLAMQKAHLHQETVDGTTYWYGNDIPLTPQLTPTTFLLPNYDEFTVAYKDRSAIIGEAALNQPLEGRNNVIFANIILENGEAVAMWKRTLKKSKVVLKLIPFTTLDRDDPLLLQAIQRYGEFLDLPVEIET
jgi:hypothetical protein